MLKRIRAALDAHIDYRGAIVGATLLGGIVFRLNYAHGASLATTAALKQATYTFFVAGFIVKNNERLARKGPNPAVSLLLAAAVSSCIAVTLTFLVHSLKGTPEPLLSTMPTAVIGPPGFLILAWRARRNGVGSAPGPK
jgi:hypothetical protein